MVLFPFCKINLGLHILSKRKDGFHNIETAFLAVPDLCDVLEIIPSEQDNFILSGTKLDGEPKDNLVCKALDLARKHTDIPACSIHLHKHIPSGAGLGGGSSDATHTLIGLNKVFDLKFSDSDIYRMSRSLGSDCAFFSQNKAVVASEKGDILKPLNSSFSECELLIIVPPVSISTKQAYSAVEPIDNRPSLENILSTYDKTLWKNILLNDFEKSLFPEFSILSNIKEKLYDMGAFYSSLSGSGSALFGLFDTKLKINKEDFPESSFIFQTRISIPLARN